METIFDVLVIGAGPGGLAASRLSSKRGLKTLLIDKKLAIGEPVNCGEGEWKKDLDDLNVPYSKAICNKIKYTKFVFPQNVLIKIPHPTYFILNREVFEKELARDAINLGCEILVDTLAKDFVFSGNAIEKVKVKIGMINKTEEIKAKFIILADGRRSLIRKYKEKINLDLSNYESYIVGVQYWMLNLPVEKKCREIYINKKITNVSYAWVFPKGENEANIGLGISLDKKPFEALNRFIMLHRDKKVKDIIRVTKMFIPTSAPLPKRQFGNVLLVGDAGRTCDPLTGGGIERAIFSGLQAAETIVEHMEENKPLEAYDEKLRSLNEKLNASYRLRKKFLRLTQDQLTKIGLKWQDAPKNKLKNLTLRELLTK